MLRVRRGTELVRRETPPIWGHNLEFGHRARSRSSLSTSYTSQRRSTVLSSVACGPPLPRDGTELTHPGSRDRSTDERLFSGKRPSQRGGSHDFSWLPHQTLLVEKAGGGGSMSLKCATITSGGWQRRQERRGRDATHLSCTIVRLKAFTQKVSPRRRRNGEKTSRRKRRSTLPTSLPDKNLACHAEKANVFTSVNTDIVFIPRVIVSNSNRKDDRSLLESAAIFGLRMNASEHPTSTAKYKPLHQLNATRRFPAGVTTIVKTPNYARYLVFFFAAIYL